MAYIQAAIKRAFLRQYWYEATQNAVGLFDCLMGFQKSVFSQVKNGQIIIGSSGGGYSTSLKTPGVADSLTQEQLIALSEELINLYELYVGQMPAGTTDATLVAAMLKDVSLQAIRSSQNDYTLTEVANGWSNGGLNQ